MMLIIILDFVFVFFFKQKTAYEMRISDWSSDVCSSDLFGEIIRAPDEVLEMDGMPRGLHVLDHAGIERCRILLDIHPVALRQGGPGVMPYEHNQISMIGPLVPDRDELRLHTRKHRPRAGPSMHCAEVPRKLQWFV